MRLTLPATAESVPHARHAAVEFARAHGASPRVADDIALAVSEACTNVVMHAYRDRDRPGELHVVADERDGLIEIVVSDAGGGVHAREDSPGMGMGMALMAAVATGVEVVHEDGATRVRLAFDLGRAAVADPDGEAAGPLAAADAPDEDPEADRA